MSEADRAARSNARAGDSGREPVDKARFVRMLHEFVRPDCVLSDPEDLAPYQCDALSAYRVEPWLVVLPETVDEICRVIRLCRERNVPVVPRGGGTGLSGGALPVAGGVVLSLAKFDRIIEIDPENRLARVQPGVRNLAISVAARPHGLYYAPDPSSQIACTIGGNVAENSGGVHCLKYGLTVHNVAELTLVTGDGELLRIGSAAFDSAGYDLLALVVGSEGLLGIVVEVTVRLLPIVECARVLLAAFDDVATAGGAVARIIAAGLIPAGLELMDNLTLRASESFAHSGYPVDAAAILLCEMDGLTEQVDADCRLAEEILRASGALSIRGSRDEAERLRLWAGRKAAFPAVGRIAPDYYCMDGTIPRHRLAEVLARIGQLSAEYGLTVGNVFHAGDGNLHPLILYDANRPGDLLRAERLGAAILEECLAVGGTVTGEHGVGVEKLDQVCLQFSPAAMEQFHAIKRAFDEHGVLNPGKAIPTLHRCAELGRMHVHRGRLPHPELERF